ncbi:MAG: glycosyl transferase, group 1 family protein [Alphaproteobacteria bacterium]|nr:glycosyl transferase, group 1 family protein [Alphaproteobacteria bacterium]
MNSHQKVLPEKLAPAILHWRPAEPLPPGTVVHLYFAPFDVPQSRALRGGRAAMDAGLAGGTLYVGHDYRDSPELTSQQEGSLLWNVPTGAQVGTQGRFSRALRLPKWWWQVYRALRGTRPVFLQCHSLATLPVAVALSRRTGAPVLYDAHELESQRNGWPAWVCRIARAVEGLLIRGVAQTTVVNDLIADWYRSAYPGRPVTTVRNLPQRPVCAVERNDRLRRNLGIGPDGLIFIYVGLLGPGRGLEMLIEAFRDLPADRHLVMLGNGPSAPMCREASRTAANIHVHEPVPPAEVLELVAGADVGLVFFAQDALSYVYSLPNKLFECLGAGLPVIANDMPAVSRVLRETGRGWILPDLNADRLRKLVSQISRQDITARLASPLNIPYWEDEVPKLIAIMRALGHHR